MWLVFVDAHPKWQTRGSAHIFKSTCMSAHSIAYRSYLCLKYLCAGTLLWKFPTMGSISSGAVCSGSTCFIGSSDANVYALDAATGVMLWRYASGAGIYSTPVLSRGWVYVTSSDNSVYCINATTGIMRWSTQTTNSLFASVALSPSAECLCVGSSDYSMYCFHTADGSAAMAPFATQGPIASTAAVVQLLPNTLTAFFGGSDGLYALNLPITVT